MQIRSRQAGEEPLILPRTSSAVEPQHLLLAVLGDYWFARDEPLPSAALLELLQKFGVKESSARQSMRRLALKGRLVQVRDGRRTSYSFPERSEKVIRTRPRFVVGFGRPGPKWNGNFTVVVFSIPEEQRELRRELRTQLLSFGFGNLHDAVWISPHDRREAALEVIGELGIQRASVFYGSESGTRDPVSLVAEAYDTVRLRETYEEFIDEYGPLVKRKPDAGSSLVTRTLMVNKWLTLRTMDPNLPLEVLPDDWPRSRAHEIFLTLYDRLGPLAAEEMRDVVRKHDADLSELVMHYTSEILNEA